MAYRYKTLGFQAFAAGGINSATGLTVPEGARACVFRPETQNIRYRSDGTAPTTTVGLLVTTTDAPVLFEGDLTNIKFISVVAGAVLHVEFYG